MYVKLPLDAKSLIKTSHRATVEAAADLAVKDPSLISSFFELLFDEDEAYSARAARVLYFAAEKDMDSIKPLLDKITKLILETNNERILMSLLKIFTISPLPKSEAKYGKLMDKCFKLLDSETQKATNKIYPMYILMRMCEKYPELKQELYITVKRWAPYSPPSIKNVAGKIIAKLEKEIVLNEE